MPTPNYSFEKRQRELAKKKKQEAKDARRREARAAGANAVDTADTDDTTADETPAPAESAAAGPRVHLRKPAGE